MLKHIKESLLTTVYFGPQGFQLFSSEKEQEEYQRQFSEQTGWDSHWFVVGVDTELGDPYLMNNNNDDVIVYTAILEGDKWNLLPIAETVDAFIQCLTLLKNANTNIQAAELYVPDETTLTDIELLAYLERQLIATSNSAEYWKYFFVCYLDWLEE